MGKALWLLVLVLGVAAMGCAPRLPRLPEFYVDQETAQRVAAHGFPKLANQYQVCCRNAKTLQLFHDMHYWDLVIVDAELLHNAPEYLGPSGILRTLHPNIIMLAYFSGADVNEINPHPITAAFTKGVAPAWYVRDIRGKAVQLFQLRPDYWTKVLNHSTAASTYLPAYLRQHVLASQRFDGIFYDWASTSISWLNHTSGPRHGRIDLDNDGRAEPDATLDRLWIAAFAQMLGHSRQLFPAGALIVGNAGWNSGAEYSGWLNGMMIENFLAGVQTDPERFGWSAVMRTYAHYQEQAVPPRLSLLMANHHEAAQGAWMRFALASALMFDGYFCFTNAPYSPAQALQAYQSAWWYDEYAVDVVSGNAHKDMRYKGYLGQPRTPAYNVQAPAERLAVTLQAGGRAAEQHVWRRDFQHGTVLVNPTSKDQTIDLQGTFRKIRGVVDTGFNDGTVLHTLSLPALSGAILLHLPSSALHRQP